jgi:mono/diheme cytochrome c family protein
MTRTLKLTLTTIAALALGAPAAAAAQGAITVDANLAKRGKTVFQNRGCGGCHAFGKKQAGPDLVGVMERRDHEWLRRWLMNTTEMLESDSLARALLVEWKNIKMPNLRVTAPDVEALFHYMQQETEKARSK